MMKIFLILTIYLSSVASKSIVDELTENEWFTFKNQHGKSYSTVEEENLRKNIWQINRERIDQHNREFQLGLHRFTMGMNKFGDLNHDEFVEMMGLKNEQNFHERKHHSSSFDFNEFTVPRSLDWRQHGYVTPVKDQLKCVASWAFAATGTLEGQHFTQTRRLVSLSEQNLVDCSHEFGNKGCQGGEIDFALQYIRVNGGIDTEESYPFDGQDAKCRFNRSTVGANTIGFRDIQSGSEPALAYAVSIIGPIAVTIDASQPSFQFYQSGVYNEPNCSSTNVNHGGLIVGFNVTDTDLYYIVKNSWGTSWGNQGYIWMSRNKNNQCGIATKASYPRVATL